MEPLTKITCVHVCPLGLSGEHAEGSQEWWCGVTLGATKEVQSESEQGQTETALTPEAPSMTLTPDPSLLCGISSCLHLRSGRPSISAMVEGKVEHM